MKIKHYLAEILNFWTSSSMFSGGTSAHHSGPVISIDCSYLRYGYFWCVYLVCFWWVLGGYFWWVFLMDIFGEHLVGIFFVYFVVFYWLFGGYFWWIFLVFICWIFLGYFFGIWWVFNGYFWWVCSLPHPCLIKNKWLSWPQKVHLPP